MKFKNDLEMWHKMGEFARHLNVVAGHNENKLIRMCKYYEYDSGAAEEICRCPSTKWEGGFPTTKLLVDFHSSDECYKCEFRELWTPYEEEEPEPCMHEELHEEGIMLESGKILVHCKKCPHLFVKDSPDSEPREPTLDDFGMPEFEGE